MVTKHFMDDFDMVFEHLANGGLGGKVGIYFIRLEANHTVGTVNCTHTTLTLMPSSHVE